MTEKLIGAIEAGGTKFICATGTCSGKLLDQVRIPTSSPHETMTAVISYFRESAQKLAGFGIASFGPINLNRDSPKYGYITSTPKLAWRDFDLVGTIARAFRLPIEFDTDVNAAAMAEARWGSARECRTLIYVTVGTGIGGGAVIDGSPLHGLLHPEMGHIRVPHDWSEDPFPGICPYHGDCLEGLASGPAIQARWGVPASTLPPDHAAFQLEAEYLARACVNWICTLSPQKLILGGGVMQPHIFPALRHRTVALLNNYVDKPELIEHIGEYIIPPGLGTQAGVLGALALAARTSTSDAID